ncbi:hypothetical protein SNEBB_009218, partial [Seison nebaliae]
MPQIPIVDITEEVKGKGDEMENNLTITTNEDQESMEEMEPSAWERNIAEVSEQIHDEDNGHPCTEEENLEMEVVLDELETGEDEGVMLNRNSSIER